MKNNEFRLTLYLMADKLRFVFYLIAGLIVLIPISVVLAADIAFSSFHSHIIVNTAIVFVIIGRILAAYKKAVEEDAIPWAIIGSIFGFLIVLVWRLFT